MANRTTIQTLIDTNKRALIKYVLVGDGTATANSTFIRFSELKYALNANGYIANTDVQANYDVSIKRAYGHCKMAAAAGYCTLRWNSNANSEILTFGSGDFNYDLGGVSGDSAVIKSPDANNQGIQLSIGTATSGDIFTLFLDLRKDSSDFDAGQTRDPAAFNKGGWIIA